MGSEMCIRDGSIGIELFEGYEEGFDGACQLVQMKSAGHFMHIEQAQDFVRHVLDFIDEADA